MYGNSGYYSRLGGVVLGYLLAGIAVVSASEKKGLGIPGRVGHSANLVSELNISWYYNWRVAPSFSSNKVSFVPMVWGLSRRYTESLQLLRSQPREQYLLTFNEPDLRSQSNIPVDKVIQHWEELTGLAEQLSSPAPAQALAPWMKDFMSKAKEKDLKIDFVAVHWYGRPRPESFLRFLDRVENEYRKPIWITEFGIADRQAQKLGVNQYSECQVIQFMASVIPELERRSYVQRYAWFGGEAYSRSVIATSSLYDESGKLTKLGTVYSLMPTSQPSQVPEVRDCDLQTRRNGSDD